MPAYPNTPGFSALDQVYLVDGDVLFQGGDGPQGEAVPAEKCLEAD